MSKVIHKTNAGRYRVQMRKPNGQWLTVHGTNYKQGAIVEADSRQSWNPESEYRVIDTEADS